MILKDPAEIIAFKCQIVDGNHNNTTRIDSAVNRACYDLMTVLIEARRAADAISADCAAFLISDH